MSASPPMRSRRRWERLSAYAPLPLVGVAALLVVLIVFTPLLVLNTREPTPGILTQAELVVDKQVDNSTMHFYVWALGETIRYATIDVGLATSFGWAGNTTFAAWGNLTWRQWFNGSDVLSVIASSPANPVALNITAHYVSPSGSAWYVGVLVFYVWSSSPPGSESLISQSGTAGVAVTTPLDVSSDLPVDILLHDAGSGATP